MKKQPNYSSVWNNYIKSLRSSNKTQNEVENNIDIQQYLTSLKKEDLRQLTEDIFTNRLDYLQPVFNHLTGKGLPLEDAAFNFLMNDIEDNLKEKIASFLDRIFQNALDGLYGDEEVRENILNRIKAFTAKNKTGLSEKYIIDTVESNQNLPKNLRVELLQILAKLKNKNIVDYSFWKKMEERTPKDPPIGIAVIEGLKRTHPDEALEVLIIYNDLDYKPTEKELLYFTHTISYALYALTRDAKENSIQTYLKTEAMVNSDWVKRMIGQDILKQPQFRYIYPKILETREANQNTAVNTFDKIIESEGKITNEILESLKKEAILYKLVDTIIEKLFYPNPNRKKLVYFRPVFFGRDEYTPPGMHEYLRDKHGISISNDEQLLKKTDQSISFSFMTESDVIEEIQKESNRVQEQGGRENQFHELEKTIEAENQWHLLRTIVKN